MSQEPAATLYESAATLAGEWVDASITANQRMARFARVWIDETLEAQQDMAQTMKKAIDGAQQVLYSSSEPASPMVFASRAGDLMRSNYVMWSEIGLRAQERLTRVAQIAFEELRLAQGDLSDRVESGTAAMRRASR